MSNWFNKVKRATNKFNVFDFGMLKMSLFTIGILFGVYFTTFFSSYLWTIWVLAIVSYIWIVYKVFIKYLN